LSDEAVVEAKESSLLSIIADISTVRNRRGAFTILGKSIECPPGPKKAVAGVLLDVQRGL
jgi:hypothetical protein